VERRWEKCDENPFNPKTLSKRGIKGLKIGVGLGYQRATGKKLKRVFGPIKKVHLPLKEKNRGGPIGGKAFA